MSADDITTCPKCGKENSLFEYYDSPHIGNEIKIENGSVASRYVFHIQYRAECKNKKCKFTYWFSKTKNVTEKGIFMPFDQNPDDDYKHYQCNVCGGSIRLNKDETMWECDTCDLQHVNIDSSKTQKK